MSRIGQSIETENRLVARGWGREKWGVTANKNKVSFGGDRNVLELGGGVMGAQPCEYIKNHFKMANFTYVNFISSFKNCPKYFF